MISKDIWNYIYMERDIYIYLIGCHIIKIIQLYVDALLVGKTETSDLTLTEGHNHFLPGSCQRAPARATVTSPVPGTLGLHRQSRLINCVVQTVRRCWCWWCDPRVLWMYCIVVRNTDANHGLAKQCQSHQFSPGRLQLRTTSVSVENSGVNSEEFIYKGSSCLAGSTE